MPTNYQARAKVAVETQVSGVRRDPVALASNVTVEHLTKRAAPLASVSRAKMQPADCSIAANVQVVLLAHEAALPSTGQLYQSAKRLIDFFVGSLLLIIAAPIILMAAVAIRADTPGSPFFFQTRLGRNGKPFRLFKLRGMYKDARERFPALYDYSRKRDLEFYFHHEHDPRVTKAGKFLRRTSIDELPNLWNVVLGHMSLVGPRPEIPDVLELYGPYREAYLSVKPGITCVSKCTGRDRLTKRETIELDLDYVRRQSFSLDLSILWRTFKGVLLRRDVF